MTDRELITAMTDPANWRGVRLEETSRRCREVSGFQNELTAELEKVGLSTSELGKAMQEHEQERLSQMAYNVEHVRKIVQSAESIQEEETEWLIPGYIPRYQISIFAADGGSGKTSIMCNLAAAITTGKHSVLTADIIPEDFTADPEDVLILSGEDDFARVLKRKLREAGACMKRIKTVTISTPDFKDIKFNSDLLRNIIQTFRPALAMFDPIQQFLPVTVNMGARNQVRDCLSRLIGFGEQYGCTFLILCHTNKQAGNSGRRRIAESADIWDIARSVLMAGDTGDGLKYISHEKCNYGELQQTILYDLDGKHVLFRGRSDLRDADYIKAQQLPRAAPARDEAKEMLLDALETNGGEMLTKELDALLKSKGASGRTIERAKTELREKRIIRYTQVGMGNAKVWKTSLANFAGGGKK